MKPIPSPRLAAALLALGGGLALAGCNTTQPRAAVPMYDPPEPRVARVSFPRDMVAGRDARVTNETDARQIITFALSLFERGRHAEAAQFLTEAAEKFTSEGNELAVACRAAAANECLLANDPVSFRTAIRALRQAMNRFQVAGADQNLSVLLSLGDIALGVERPTSLTPMGLRDLYGAPRNAAATENGTRLAHNTEN